MANPFGPTLDVPAGDPAFQRMYLQALMQQQELAYKARVMEAQRPTFGSSLLEGLTKAIPASIGSYVDYLFKRQLLDQQGQQALAREAAQEQGLLARTRLQQEGELARLLATQRAKQAAEQAQQQTLGGAWGAFTQGLEPPVTETPTGRYVVGPARGESSSSVVGPGIEQLYAGHPAVPTALAPDTPPDLIDQLGLWARREPIERVPVLGSEVTRTTGAPPSMLDAFRALSDEHRAVLAKALPAGVFERMLDPAAASKYQTDLDRARADLLKAQSEARVATATADPKAREAQARADEAQVRLDTLTALSPEQRAIALHPSLKPDKPERPSAEPPYGKEFATYLVTQGINSKAELEALRDRDPARHARLVGPEWEAYAQRISGMRRLGSAEIGDLVARGQKADAAKMELVTVPAALNTLTKIAEEHLSDTRLGQWINVGKDWVNRVTGVSFSAPMRELRAAGETFVSKLTRAMGQTGVLTDVDLELARSGFIPQPGDSPEVAGFKIRLLREFYGTVVQGIETYRHGGIGETRWRPLLESATGRIAVRRKSDGTQGSISRSAFDPNLYERVSP